jgi:hypothetical protein
MKDQRVQVFRTTLEALIESLNAFVRVSRWSDEAPSPEPLRLAASKLMDRIGSAERLASGKFNGTPQEVDRVNTMCDSMRKLDAAYVKYRRRVEGAPAQKADALTTLEAEVGEAAAVAGY